MRVAIFTNLLAYSVVVSQPLFYVVAMTSAQRALSASAYVELRQQIDSVMNRRVPPIYLATLVTILALLVLSWRARSWTVFITTLLGVVCLLVDIALTMRWSLPINGVIDRWSTTSYPQDWETYRNEWFAVFGYRQAVLLIGYISLLVGAVFQT